jgi:tetratricopeptide (TPR) repeat protein
VHWAHGVRDAFPDGQLYVNLHGYDPAEPLPAADALARFLRALGLADQDIPADADERAARYRSMLDGQRMLIVLDNAGAVDQVRPLLPGTPSSTVVVTSRDSLAGLVVRNGARRMDLDLFPPADAIVLVCALIGGRARADPAAASMLAGQCARLPLALRVAAELAAARPALTLAQLVGELADEQRRLDLLDAGGDARTAVRGVFSWSYRHLPPDAARVFRLIGQHPGPDLDAYAVAALAGATIERARDVCELLARAHLIHPARPGRYAMHDLLRAYSTDLSRAAGEDRAALGRLFDYYLAAAAAAMDILVPAERDRRPRIAPPATPIPPLTDAASVRAWLDAERPTFVAVAACAAARGWPGHATRLSAIVCRYVETGGHYADAVAIHAHAADAAHAAGDRSAEAHALNHLGFITGRLGQHHEGVTHLHRSLALFQEAGDRSGAARALSNLASAQLRQGRYPQAASCYRQALEAFEEIGDSIGEARALNGLGLVDWQQGRYERAASHFRRALALFRRRGDRSNEAHALGNLGMVVGRQGDDARAAEHLEAALALLRRIGDRSGTASVLTDLGSVACRQGRYREAFRYQRQALALFRMIGERAGEAEALNGLGEVLLATAKPGPAHVRHAEALTLASDISNRNEQARAHNGLGAALLAEGLTSRARAHYAAALALASESGDPYQQDRARDGLAFSERAYA